MDRRETGIRMQSHCAKWKDGDLDARLYLSPVLTVREKNR